MPTRKCIFELSHAAMYKLRDLFTNLGQSHKVYFLSFLESNSQNSSCTKTFLFVGTNGRIIYIMGINKIEESYTED